MSRIITESDVEQAALDILSEELGYKTLYGPDIAPPPEGTKPERKNYSDVVLVERLVKAIDKLNPTIPSEAKEEAVKKLLRTESPKLIVNNQTFHRMLVSGMDVEYRNKEGRIEGGKVWLFDFDKPEKNEFLTVNQFTVMENNFNRRPDIVIFVNGLPLAVIELKNPADENATVWTAFNQFETYKNEIPSLFSFNEMLVVSDGMEARAGTITSGKEWFMLWRTVDGKEIKSDIRSKSMEVLLKGMFQKDRFLASSNTGRVAYVW